MSAIEGLSVKGWFATSDRLKLSFAEPTSRAWICRPISLNGYAIETLLA